MPDDDDEDDYGGEGPDHSKDAAKSSDDSKEKKDGEVDSKDETKPKKEENPKAFNGTNLLNGNFLLAKYRNISLFWGEESKHKCSLLKRYPDAYELSGFDKVRGVFDSRLKTNYTTLGGVMVVVNTGLDPS